MKKNGTQMCLRFHTLRYYFKDYNFENGRGNLGSDKANDLKVFNSKAKDNGNKFQNQRRGGNNQAREESQGNNHTSNDTTATGESPAPPISDTHKWRRVSNIHYNLTTKLLYNLFTILHIN